MKAQSVRLEPDTVQKLKELEIEMGWVKLKTYEDKINHLIWFYWSHRNNNWKH